MDGLVSAIVTPVTTTLTSFGGDFITTILPVLWSILAVAAVVGFAWLLVRRFTGR